MNPCDLEIDHLESQNSCVREDFPSARGSLIIKAICGKSESVFLQASRGLLSVLKIRCCAGAGSLAATGAGVAAGVLSHHPRGSAEV